MIPKFDVAKKEIQAAREQAAERLRENDEQRKKAQDEVQAAQNRLNQLVSGASVTKSVAPKTNNRKKTLLYTGLILGTSLILAITLIIIKNKKQKT